MNMSTVEVETGTYITRWAFWNPATWSIPKLYWDAWSQEQRVHAICRQLEKVIKYADYLGVNVDDIAARLKAIEDGQLDEIITAAVEAWFEENEPEIVQAIEDLQGDIGSINGELDAIKADSWVTNNRIADGSVTESKIADGSVTENKIATDAVTENKIADSSVTESKIADDAVTESKIASGSVGYDEIKPANINADCSIDMAQPIIRRECNPGAGIQGGNVVNINGNDFVVFYDGYPGYGNNKLVMYSEQNVLVDEYQINAQHGNSIAVKGTKVYVAEGETNRVHVFEVSSGAFVYDSLLVFTNATSTWGFAVDNDGNYIVDEGTYADFYSPDNLATPFKTIHFETSESEYADVSSFNGYCYDSTNNLIGKLQSARANVITFYDPANGKKVKTIVFDTLFGYVYAHEIEFVAMRGNDVWFAANASRSAEAVNKIVYTVLKTNLLEPFGIAAKGARFFSNWTGIGLYVNYNETTGDVFPTMSDNTHPNVKYVEDLYGFAELARRCGSGLQVDMETNITEGIISPHGCDWIFNIGNHAMTFFYLAYGSVYIRTVNSSILFTESYWTSSYLFDLRYSKFHHEQGNPNPGGSYEPTKGFIRAIGCEYYINADNLQDAASNSFTQCLSWR